MFEKSLATAAALFLTAFLLHVAFWRVFRPRRQIRWLGMVFLGAPVFTAVLGILDSENTGAPARGLALCLLAAAGYILSYPAMQAKCPSLDMVHLIGRAGPAGLRYEELARHFSTQELVGSRRRDLHDEGLVKRKPDGTERISFPARLLLHVMQWLRLWLGLDEGKG